MSVLDTFDTQIMNFIRKYFSVLRINKASFFEVTTSRSCEAVNGFHNVTFGPGGKAIISCSVFRQYSWFQPLKAFSAFGNLVPRVLSYPSLRSERESGEGNRRNEFAEWHVAWLAE